jgi:hypothetical protein
MNLLSHENILIALRASVVIGGVVIGVTLPPPANAAPAASFESFASIAQRPDEVLKNELSELPQRVLEGAEARVVLGEEGWASHEHADAGSFYRDDGEARASLAESGIERGLLGHDARGGGWFQEREYDNNCIRLVPMPVPEIGRSLMLVVGFLAVTFMVRRRNAGNVRGRRFSLAAA